MSNFTTVERLKEGLNIKFFSVTFIFLNNSLNCFIFNTDDQEEIGKNKIIFYFCADWNIYIITSFFVTYVNRIDIDASIDQEYDKLGFEDWCEDARFNLKYFIIIIIIIAIIIFMHSLQNNIILKIFIQTEMMTKYYITQVSYALN